MMRYWAPYALVGGESPRVEWGVLLEVADGRFHTVRPGVAAPPDAVRLSGLAIPGLANAHSHAFHRALRGRTHVGGGTFWTWRKQMYALAERLNPDSYYRLARAVYGEMVLAGITSVGEFHYLHHEIGGIRYDDPNEMGLALVAAARDAGLRITLLDTCYLAGGFGKPLEGVQLRFGDVDADGWAVRAEALLAQLTDRPGVDPYRVRVGAAVHSVRGVPAEALGVVAGWSQRFRAPLHVHLSEQRAENEACQAAHGVTPTQLLADHGVLGELTTAVHATHLNVPDIGLLGASHTGVCLCPTTEQDLADGIGLGRNLLDAGSPLSLGTDGHSMIDIFAEAKAMEMHERLRTETRGHFSAEELWTAATSTGHASLGWGSTGVIESGARADLVTLDLDGVHLAGIEPTAAIFAATAADVRDVIIEGTSVVQNRVHGTLGDPGALLRDAIEELRR
ncbi:formiminoglutamate deiminase [Actinoalloteichus hymeniacidonis]|uniref:Formiminoglutamate deiminase n=2 Tax=Actinoalloteichus hymeniacidonis TaxID=340345 RepID=A0AAC9HTP0_9PSEU|nr:formiminoglutamate deiminase [Actinoalloteichus hymeniacidonis]MBB5906525.1 formiminoglutamate deiminase [Actinoalloteichus hymeniacidonis]